jgi:hypothetical protein
MTGAENSAMQGFQDFSGGGSGVGAPYTVPQGKDLSLDNLQGPDFQSIQDSGQTIKDLADQKALKEMQSRAAAGGNALSGALMGQEGDYLRGSNADFTNTMGQMRLADYEKNRDLQAKLMQGNQSDATQRAGYQTSYNQSLLGNNTANRGLNLQSLQDLMQAGGTQRGAANQEIQGQYGDFLRQGSEFKDAARYPDLLGLGIMNSQQPGSHQNTFGATDASQLSAWLQQLFGGGGGFNTGQGISDFASGLAGGAGGSTSGDGIGYDGEQLLAALESYDGEWPSQEDWASWPQGAASYDGQSPAPYYGGAAPGAYDGPGPSSYKDAAYYNKALDAGQAKAAQTPGKASTANKTMTMLALLMQALGIGGNQNQQKARSAGGGQSGGGQPSAANSLGSKAGQALSDLFGGGKMSTGLGNFAINPRTGASKGEIPTIKNDPAKTAKDAANLPPLDMTSQDLVSYNDPSLTQQDLAAGSNFDTSGYMNDPSNPFTNPSSNDFSGVGTGADTAASQLFSGLDTSQYAQDQQPNYDTSNFFTGDM